MSKIPPGTRTAVYDRDRYLCVRCERQGHDIHHRMRRREGGHGMWNLILLCRECHAWAHANPAEARETGYILSSYLPWDEAMLVPVQRIAGTSIILSQPSSQEPSA